MQQHATDPGVFIRSMANRGHLGGLSGATPQAVRVLDAAGFDVILIETVGVGQDEVEIAGMADTTMVIVAPGLGDSIQAAKAGILEIGDVFVVNKSDKPGAQEAVRDLRGMIAMARRAVGDWKPLIVLTTAAEGEGIGELVTRLDEHGAWLGSSGSGRAQDVRERAGWQLADRDLRRGTPGTRRGGSGLTADDCDHRPRGVPHPVRIVSFGESGPDAATAPFRSAELAEGDMRNMLATISSQQPPFRAAPTWRPYGWARDVPCCGSRIRRAEPVRPAGIGIGNGG